MAYNQEETAQFIKPYWELQKQEQAPKPLESSGEKKNNLDGFFDKGKVNVSQDEGKNKVPCSPKRRSLKHFKKSSSRYPDYFHRRRLPQRVRSCQRASKTRPYSSSSSSESPRFHFLPKFDDACRFSKTKSRAPRSSHCCSRRFCRGRSSDSFSCSENESCCHSSNYQRHRSRHRSYQLQHSRSNSSCSRSPYPHRQMSAKPRHRNGRSTSSRAVEPQSLHFGRSYDSPRGSYPAQKSAHHHQRHRSQSFERWSRSPGRRDDVQVASLDTFHRNKRRQEEFIKTMNLKKKIKNWIMSNDKGLESNVPGPSYRSPTLPHLKKEPYDDCKKKSSRDSYLDKSKGDFFCKLCDSHMNNIIMWEQHVRGQRHLKNVKKLPGESIGKMKSYKLPLVVSKLEERIDKEASGELIVGLDFIRETRGSRGEMYSCFLCGSCSTNCDILQHLQLLKHRRNYLKQLNIERKPNKKDHINKECYKMLKKYGRGKVEVYKSKN